LPLIYHIFSKEKGAVFSYFTLFTLLSNKDFIQYIVNGWSINYGTETQPFNWFFRRSKWNDRKYAACAFTEIERTLSQCGLSELEREKKDTEIDAKVKCLWLHD
jgi:hypothetical protein